MARRERPAPEGGSMTPKLPLIPLCCAAALLTSTAFADQGMPMPSEGDYAVPEFHFQSGEVLQGLRLHYTTYGRPQRDASGHVSNAVLIMHGTGGSGQQF